MQKSLIKSLKPYCAIAIEKQRRYPTLQSWCYVEVWLLFPHNLCSFGMKRTAVIPQYSVYTSLKILQFLQWISIERFMKEKKKPPKHWYCSLFVIIITDVLMKVCLHSPKCIVILNLYFTFSWYDWKFMRYIGKILLLWANKSNTKS